MLISKIKPCKSKNAINCIETVMTLKSVYSSLNKFYIRLLIRSNLLILKRITQLTFVIIRVLSQYQRYYAVGDFEK